MRHFFSAFGDSETISQKSSQTRNGRCLPTRVSKNQAERLSCPLDGTIPILSESILKTLRSAASFSWLDYVAYFLNRSQQIAHCSSPSVYDEELLDILGTCWNFVNLDYEERPRQHPV